MGRGSFWTEQEAVFRKPTIWDVQEIKFHLKAVATSSHPQDLASLVTGCFWWRWRMGRSWLSARRESVKRLQKCGGSHLAPVLATPQFEQASTPVERRARWW